MININKSFPKKIVCLTEETTETLYHLKADDLIIGITAYTVRPLEASKTKPIVAKYIHADIAEIIALNPDIVLTWSDLQAEISAKLIKHGIEVFAFNHRSLEGILSMVLKLGALIGKAHEAEEFANILENKLTETMKLTQQFERRPKVYFEEWYNPLISGIRWVSELIEVCGGDDVFSENRAFQNAKPRIIENTNEVIKRNPDIILASWCGKPFIKDKMLRRNGWHNINAIKNNQIFEIDASIILQPGPAPILDGIDILLDIFSKWQDQ